MSYSSEVLADSPQLYARFNGGSGADSSGNGHNFTAGTLPTGVAGLLVGDADGAGSFNGTTTAVAWSWASWMNTTNFSVDLLLKTSQSTAALIVSRDQTSGGQRLWQIGINASGLGGKLYVTRVLDASNVVSVITTSTTMNVNDGVARHIGVTYDGTTLRIYVNGVLDASSAWTGGIFAGNAGIFVGHHEGGGFLYSGVLDEVAYYTTALSGTRVAVHAAAATAAPPSGTASLSLSATAGGAAAAGASGALSLSGSAGGSAPGTAAAAIGLVASGSTVAPSPASGTGSLTLTATMTPAAAAAATAALILTATGSVVLAAGGIATLELDATAIALALYRTDTSNSHYGRRRRGRGTTSVDRAPAPLPPGRTFGTRYDKAIAYPIPTMVDGRPT